MDKHLRPKILFLLSFIILFYSCKKNTFYSQRFGLIEASDQDLKDIEEITDIPVGSLPDKHLLNMPPVGSQGAQGSCVGWAVGYATASFHVNQKNNTHYSSSNELCSPSYLYNQYSKGNCDAGSTIPALLNITTSQGICSWQDMPYNENDCSTQPDDNQRNNAISNRMRQWKLVNKNNIELIKKCLYANYPVIIAVVVTENLMTISSPYIWEGRYGKEYGGHAITVVGYDDDKSAFKIQNSWGTGWGEHGFFWISYDFFPNAVTGRECYIMIP